MNNYMKTIISGLKQWVSSQKSDWNQNDSSAANFIKNRPFYSEEKEKVLFSGNIPAENAWDDVYGAEGLAYGLSFTTGQIYKITFDNVEYLCECKLLNSEKVFGNTMIVGEGEETEEPFFIGYSDNWGLCVFCLTEGTHSLSISGTVEEVHQIDKKFVPMPDLADVATSGDYNDLVNTPEIPTGMVHYNEKQELSASETKTARRNIKALTFNDYNYQWNDGNIYYTGVGEASYVRLPNSASTSFDISSDGMLWSSKNLLSSQSWKIVTKGFDSDSLIFSDGAGYLSRYSVSSGGSSTYSISTLADSNNAPYSGMQIINSKIVLLCSSGDKVMVSGSYFNNFSAVSLPITTEWISFLNVGGTRLLLIPKTGDKGLVSTDGTTWTEFALPESNDWLAPNIITTSGSKTYYYLFLVSSNETEKTYRYSFDSSTWETITLSQAIKPGIIVGTTNSTLYLLPQNGSDYCYKFFEQSTTSSRRWVIYGACLGLASNPTYTKIDNSNFFLVGPHLSRINYYSERLVLDQNFILREEQYSETVLNSELAETVLPYLQINGLATTKLATTTAAGLMSAADKTKLNEMTAIKNLKDGTATGSLRGAGVASDYSMGNYATAFGKDTTASGFGSHAEGELTTASNYYSHAEGYNTTASGQCSHAEGRDTTASHGYTHAEGYNTIASGIYSHAEGSYTKAASEYQHVQGKYNIEDSAKKYAHIVGNGESDTARSNAHTLDWNGNAWFAGNIYVGGTGQDDAAAVEVALKSDLASLSAPTAISLTRIDEICNQTIYSTNEVTF